MARRSAPVGLALWLCVGAALIAAAAAQKKLHKDQLAFGNNAVAAIKDLAAKAKEYKLARHPGQQPNRLRSPV
jgi:hypothetical protein